MSVNNRNDYMREYMRERRARQRAENPEMFLLKQRQQRQNLRDEKKILIEKYASDEKKKELTKERLISMADIEVDKLREAFEKAKISYDEKRGDMTPEEIEAKREKDKLYQRFLRAKKKIEQPETKKIQEIQQPHFQPNAQEIQQPVLSRPSRRGALPIINNLHQFFKESHKEKPLSEHSIINYISKLNTVSRFVLGHPFNGDANFLLNADNVINKFLEHGAHLKEKKDYLSPIIDILTFFDADKGIIKQYQSLLQELLKETNKRRGENKMSEKEKETYLPLKEVQKKIDEYSFYKGNGKKGAIDKRRLFNKLIGELYFENNLIARNDYVNMKIVNENKRIGDLDKNLNYLQFNPQNGNVQKFILFNYKTSKKYGRQDFDIPSKLRKTLNLFISVNNLKPGDFLFENEHGGQYNDSNFSKIIADALLEITGKRITIDMARRIWYTEYHKTVHTINEDEAFARRFLHDKGVGKTYMRR